MAKLDPYKGYTPEQLKTRCGELCRALDRWQKMALIVADGGVSSLPEDMKADFFRLRAAYNDE